MSHRENTCRKKTCPFWARYKDNCPNYMEIPWEADDGGKYYTDDCIPKRGMLLQLETYNMTLGTRRDFNKLGNANIEILKIAALHIPGMEVVEGDFEDKKQIEETVDHGKDTD